MPAFHRPLTRTSVHTRASLRLWAAAPPHNFSTCRWLCCTASVSPANQLSMFHSSAAAYSHPPWGVVLVPVHPHIHPEMHARHVEKRVSRSLHTAACLTPQTEAWCRHLSHVQRGNMASIIVRMLTSLSLLSLWMR